MKKVSLILLAALLFLLVRNLPLCLLMPLWAHGDEIGHFDYVLKLTRGQIPQPTDLIESDLFLLHKVHYDSRYISKFRLKIRRPEGLGVARYSYDAPFAFQKLPSSGQTDPIRISYQERFLFHW